MVSDRGFMAFLQARVLIPSSLVGVLLWNWPQKHLKPPPPPPPLSGQTLRLHASDLRVEILLLVVLICHLQRVLLKEVSD